MRLSPEQSSAYQRTGFVLLDALFSSAEVATIHREIDALADSAHDSNLREGDGRTLRALHGCDQRSMVLAELVRDPRLLLPVEQMLGEQVYLHQLKVSMKSAFEGDVWRWHQDHAFWHHNDGVPESKAVTAAVFLNTVTEFNAPIWLIPGTRSEPLLPCREFDATAVPADAPEWHENVVARFKYTLADSEVRRLAREHGIASPKGRAGTVLFFHSSVPHASTWNISPWERIAILVSYNAVSNRPPGQRERRGAHRPAFLAAQSYEPIVSNDKAAA